MKVKLFIVHGSIIILSGIGKYLQKNITIVRYMYMTSISDLYFIRHGSVQ